MVRPGDTLASIAQRYYGDPRRESVLVTENGLTTQGGSAIVVGMRLHIPWVRYHTVAAGETWQQIADRYYGDARRSFVIIESNRNATDAQPAEGAELLIPTHCGTSRGRATASRAWRGCTTRTAWRAHAGCGASTASAAAASRAGRWCWCRCRTCC
ncbi:MAG: LysM peptidoglycan-binding domain-containing protein [Sandaracinaceae bacterium]|nr:LysM peptidoglycan-binding domain-containing protein [Sandaracinaceae bacterium]